MRTITTAEDLDALPLGSVVLASNLVAWQRGSRNTWFSADCGSSLALHYALPARVLYVPGEPTPSLRPVAPGLGVVEEVAARAGVLGPASLRRRG